LDLSPPDWGALPFLLCVAQHRSNKNILLALRVFERLLRAQQLASNMQFLVVGIPGPETSVIHEFISASGLAENVILLSGISEARLQWCYRNCGVLIAPSTLEGFGLPVAEALLAGSRIVCSDIPAFRELGASHCHYVPLGPHAVDAFADAICLALRHERPKPVVLPQLSAEVIAAEYLRHYQSLIPADATHAGSLQVSSSSEERRNPIWNSNQKAKQ
jgi:glycosyltransferase involved in cell wall biosynthesis